MDTVICPNCWKEMKATTEVCIYCGANIISSPVSNKDTINNEIVGTTSQNLQDTNLNDENFTDKHNPIIFVVMSVVCFLVSIFFFNKGYDKITNYYGNTYVGGDAYNYIINGTYSTSFFVLGIGLFLAGLILILIYVHLNTQYEILMQNERIIERLNKISINDNHENALGTSKFHN